MEGAALAAKRAYDIAITTAWHVETFARTKKMKSLADYLGITAERSSSLELQNAKGIAFFHRLQARGVGVVISRNQIN